MACSGFVSLFSRTAAVVAVVALAGCTTTGQFFKTEALANFVPGQTTFTEAVAMLGAEPVNTYAQLNGAMLARWAHKGSVLTDAIYFRQEATLRFDSQGRFVGVVDTVNILIPPRDQNAPANLQVLQQQQQQAVAPVVQPVQEVERIIIIDAAGNPQSAGGRSPVVEPRVTKSEPAVATPIVNSSTMLPAGTAGTTGVANPNASATNATRAPSNSLEHTLTNPTVTYPVPSGRR